MRARPPGPKGLPVVGNGYHYARDPFTFMDACARAYGDVVALRFGPQDVLMVTDPSVIRRVLVAEADRFRKVRFRERELDRLLGDGLLLSEGEDWRAVRRLAEPAFRPERVADIADVVVDYAEEAADAWRPGATVDVGAEMARLTVRVVADVMLGVRLTEAQVARLQSALDPVGRAFEPDPRRAWLPPWLPVPNPRYERAVATLDDVVEELIERRRARGIDGGDDLGAALLRARRDGRIDDERLRDELVTMLLAGHDTTALALTYAWYLLSANPDAAATLHDELDAVLGGRTPTADDLPALDYAGRVVRESMRRYPPVYSLFRRPVADVTLGGYPVSGGTPLLLPQWVVHRDPRFYDDPDAFDPDRWRPERSADRPAFAYFPFGGGPRACVARRFATTEATLVLATLAGRYRLAHEGDGPPALRASITMHPDGPVEMTVLER